MEAIKLPDDINKDIQGTGWSVVDVRKHMLSSQGQVYILSLRKSVDMNWDHKDFARFKWVYDWSPLMTETRGIYKLKIKF